MAVDGRLRPFSKSNKPYTVPLSSIQMAATKTRYWSNWQQFLCFLGAKIATGYSYFIMPLCPYKIDQTYFVGRWYRVIQNSWLISQEARTKKHFSTDGSSFLFIQEEKSVWTCLSSPQLIQISCWGNVACDTMQTCDCVACAQIWLQSRNNLKMHKCRVPSMGLRPEMCFSFQF